MSPNRITIGQEFKYNIKPEELDAHVAYWRGRRYTVVEDRYLPNGMLRIKVRIKSRIMTSKLSVIKEENV